MLALKNVCVDCPYCGEKIDCLIDCTVFEQSYIEDCHVCCRPISFAVSIQEDDKVLISVSHENE